MTAKKRDYKNATAYESTPEQIRKRSMRNQARAAMEKKLGRKLPSNVDVGHKVPLDKGGTNAPSNLKLQSESDNTAWRKGRKGYSVPKA